MDAFAVVLESYESLDPNLLGPMLSETLGLVKYDAMRMAREAKGIIAEALEAKVAQKLVSALQKADIPARQVPQQKILRLGRPIHVRQVQFTEPALLVFLGYTGVPEEVPWEEVTFVSVGVVEQQTPSAGRPIRRQRHTILGGIMAGAASFAGGGLMGGVAMRMIQKARTDRETAKKKRRANRTVSSAINELTDLFYRDEATRRFQHIRLTATQLYYDQILGDESTKNFRFDFRILLIQLIQHAPKALFSPGLEPFILSLENPEVDISASIYVEEQEFTQFNRWQLQMLELEGPQTNLTPPASTSA